jgi:RNA polymerase sigma factor (sigma-70 family)
MVRMRSILEVEPTSDDFGKFVGRVYTRLARACLLLTGSPAEAEDLAQEALARLCARWEFVRSMDSPEGYLFRTALNLNRKRLRRLAVRARHAQGFVVGPDEIDAAEERLDVLRAVAMLPRGQREALVLVEWLDLDPGEAARLLGIAPASVRGRLHRARTTLRERFGGTNA